MCSLISQKWFIYYFPISVIYNFGIIISARVTNFIEFLLKILQNGFSLWKCLLIKFKKYFSILIIESLQKGELNQIIFLFLFLQFLFTSFLLLLLSSHLL